MVSVSNGVVRIESFSLNIPSFSLQDKCVHVIGSNGSGKSTFLRVVAGILDLTVGKRILPTDLKVGYVPQNYRSSLMPWLSARDNVQLISKSDECIKNLLKLGFKKSDLDKRPHQLSGGQCQRVAIVRDAIDEHDLLILDEPFSGLDIYTIPLVGKLLKEKMDKGMKIILTSHTSLPKSMTSNLATVQVVRISDNTAEVRDET
ncbi:ATP-binding cassette domain-containing protein [Candidatus Wolfebacteria bacterium]|nr:ATP-binding cassette domain-containing protein [Candidatus Wolfebacteria bacterium]